MRVGPMDLHPLKGDDGALGYVFQGTGSQKYHGHQNAKYKVALKLICASIVRMLVRGGGVVKFRVIFSEGEFPHQRIGTCSCYTSDVMFASHILKHWSFWLESSKQPEYTLVWKSELQRRQRKHKCQSYAVGSCNSSYSMYRTGADPRDRLLFCDSIRDESAVFNIAPGRLSHHRASSIRRFRVCKRRTMCTSTCTPRRYRSMVLQLDRLYMMAMYANLN